MTCKETGSGTRPVLSASYKTDIPAFYGDWFVNRLQAGHVTVHNVWNNRPFTVDLRPHALSGIVLWTRNIKPFLHHMPAVDALGLPTVIQFTVTGYPRNLDRFVPDAYQAVEMIRTLAGARGSDAVVWRYDPILFTSLTPPHWHRETFSRLAQDLRGAVNEVVVSFAQFYSKTRQSLARVAQHSHLTWHDPDDDTKKELLGDFLAIAQDNGMALSLCAQRHLLVPGLQDAACIDTERLSRLAGQAVITGSRSHRASCACAASKDIGAYNTCPQGCIYCYATTTHVKAREAAQSHKAGQEAL
ncbi:DUF1848 domain-containing protein [Haematospirillum jordaniae]|uniref:DUF1848 domain-containing protein n=1 Tax=Haematospirillum jordaniae TaxID=1549855 RepID=UPI0014328D58|nr:DUF1848 domain-containing protein [Haematospirillum jordaniae]NKD86360.1 DUF1848 domain-containing protein [Haematospirillum jordaniae]